jgi:filamentous hemagglutinin
MGQLLIRAPVSGSSDVTINVGSQGIGADIGHLGQVVIEPVMIFSESTATLNNDLNGDLGTASSYLSSASPVIAARLSSPSLTPIAVQAGVEIKDSNLSDSLTLPPLDLSSYSQQGQVIDLTVRAAGSINLSGTISDGIVNGALYQTMSSGSLRFTAGADLGSANPLAVVAHSGADLTLASNAVVQTGTGDIDLVASNDIVFSPGASAYTTGLAAVPPITIKLGGAQSPINFLTGGGNIVVDAGEDVVGQAVPVSVSNWQARTVKGGLGEWGVNLDAFDQNPWTLATFGGGDLTIAAARDALNVSAATADSMALSTPTTQTLFPGGGMVVQTGRDITSGQFFVADGVGTLNAGRSFATNLSIVSPSSASIPVGSLFALQNSQISLWAQDAITIDAVVNPTVMTQPLATGNVSSVFFYTYGANSAFNAQSTAGAVTLNSNPASMGLLLGSTVASDCAAAGCLSAYPANLKLV